MPNSSDDRATALVLLARTLLRQKGPAEALGLLEQASELKSTDDDVKTYWLIGKGEVFGRERDWKKAREQFELARKNAEDSHNAYAALEARILANKAGVAIGDRSAKDDLAQARQQAANKKFSLLALAAVPSAPIFAESQSTSIH
jgi:tetratricopeptide (TPR) repeat protein